MTFLEWGYGLGKKEIIFIIHDYIKANTKAYLFLNGTPGNDWCREFLKRHPEISIGKPQALHICKAKASTPKIINHWFINIHEANFRGK